VQFTAVTGSRAATCNLSIICRWNQSSVLNSNIWCSQFVLHLITLWRRFWTHLYVTGACSCLKIYHWLWIVTFLWRRKWWRWFQFILDTKVFYRMFRQWTLYTFEVYTGVLNLWFYQCFNRVQLLHERKQVHGGLQRDQQTNKMICQYRVIWLMYLLFSQFLIVNFVAHAKVCTCVSKQLVWTKAT